MASSIPNAYILFPSVPDMRNNTRAMPPAQLKGLFNCQAVSAREPPPAEAGFTFTFLEHSALINAHPAWQGHCIIRLAFAGADRDEGVKGSRARTIFYANENETRPDHAGGMYSTLDCVQEFLDEQRASTILRDELRGMRQSIADERSHGQVLSTDDVLKLALHGEPVALDVPVHNVFLDAKSTAALPAQWTNGASFNVVKKQEEADVRVLVLRGKPVKADEMAESASKADKNTVVLVYPEGNWTDDQLTDLVSKITENPLHVVGHSLVDAARLVELAVQRGRTRRARARGSVSVRQRMKTISQLSSQLSIDTARM